MSILLSVVIPTKNRYETLIPLVDALIKNISVGMEIIIQDNSDDNSIMQNRYDAIETVKYYYHKEWLSVVDNCDMAISHSNGEYVTFIGDDDAVAPQIFELAQLLKENNVDSCVCSYLMYRWPSALGNSRNSFEYYKEYNHSFVPKIEKMLTKLLRTGAHNKKGCPCVYHGIVKRELLNQVYETTGSYFPGPSPDMANSTSLLLFAKRHVVTDIPFIIDGYSKASTGHLTESKKHVGKLEDQTFLPKDTVANWTPYLPKIWLPNTIWPESAVQALKRCGLTDLANKLNFEAVYIKIGIMYPQFRGICLSMAMKNLRIGRLITTFFSSGFSYLKGRFEHKEPVFVIKHEINIEDAIHETSEIIDKNDLMGKFKSFLHSATFRMENES